MQVSIDRELCESNGVCAGLLPSVFELRDDDVLYVLQPSPPEELREQVQLAEVRCPRQAITVTD
jgi:ferredoxin